MEYEDWRKLIDTYRKKGYKIEFLQELFKRAYLSKENEYYKLDDEGTLKKMSDEESLETKEWIDKLYSKLVCESEDSK